MSERPEQTPSKRATKSKSQRKREAASLQALGERLVGLSSSQLAKMPLSAGLREAIEQAQQIRSHQAHRRQLRLVGKYLRASDAEDIQRAIDRLERAHNAAVRRLHQVEYWRERLIAGNDQSLNEMLAHYPEADRRRLSQLVRVAQKELSVGQPCGASRKLYRYLREILTAPVDPTGVDPGV